MSPRAVVLPSLAAKAHAASKPHIYKRGRVWWVLCKHRNPTGPYYFRRTAFSAARDIWCAR